MPNPIRRILNRLRPKPTTQTSVYLSCSECGWGILAIQPEANRAMENHLQTDHDMRYATAAEAQQLIEEANECRSIGSDDEMADLTRYTITPHEGDAVLWHDEGDLVAWVGGFDLARIVGLAEQHAADLAGVDREEATEC